MTKWPEFITKDLGESDGDDAELTRRWEQYDREMKAIIAAGGVHQDDDGWWIDDATGELIGPDPEIERPSTGEELRNAKPFREVFPELAASIDRELRKRGRPIADNPKQPVTIRLNPETIAKFKATGKGWQSRMSDILDSAKP
jgi:uncharacterized protein (DUF4415 family)